jgi:hypothetical protein
MTDTTTPTEAATPASLPLAPPQRARTANSDQPRRRKDDDYAGGTANLTIPPDVLDTANFEYRWANDQGARLHQLYGQDWDIVGKDGKTSKVDDEGAIRHRTGIRLDGGPLFSYLLRKPKRLATEDRSKKAAIIDRNEKARLSQIPSDAEAPENAYTPKR